MFGAEHKMQVIGDSAERVTVVKTTHGSMVDGVQTVARKHKVGTVPVKVLDGVSGVLRPGRLTLLMGPPGAGKSVFMKVGLRVCMVEQQVTCKNTLYG